MQLLSHVLYTQGSQYNLIPKEAGRNFFHSPKYKCQRVKLLPQHISLTLSAGATTGWYLVQVKSGHNAMHKLQTKKFITPHATLITAQLHTTGNNATVLHCTLHFTQKKLIFRPKCSLDSTNGK